MREILRKNRLVSLSGFVIRVMLASLNEFSSVPSLSPACALGTMEDDKGEVGDGSEAIAIFTPETAGI